VKRDPPPYDPDLLEKKKYISSDELAVFLDVPYGTVDQWASRKTGPEYIKVGRERKYPTEGVAKWLKAKERKGAA
jgi:hypothetical protein